MTDTRLIQRWQQVTNTLPRDVTLIAVSKYTHDENVNSLLQAGQVDFAEARPQNLRDRAQHFPQANWHMIGPLQKNKAKYVGRFAHIWHSCCDIETAKEVAKHVSSRTMSIFIQVNISGEPQKQGVSPEQLALFLAAIAPIEQLEVIGLMGMAAKDGNPKVAFSLLRKCRDKIIKTYPKAHGLCMGMSNDWQIAIEEGATMIRVGSEIFGQN